MNATHLPSGLTVTPSMPSFIVATVRVSPGRSTARAWSVDSPFFGLRLLVNSRVRLSGVNAGPPS